MQLDLNRVDLASIIDFLRISSSRKYSLRAAILGSVVLRLHIYSLRAPIQLTRERPCLMRLLIVRIVLCIRTLW